MTIAEFLLARIAEDEEFIPKILDEGSGDFGGHAEHGPPEQRSRVTFNRARVLAECEAKRRTIAGLVGAMEDDYAPWNENLLRIMASVYADHRGPCAHCALR